MLLILITSSFQDNVKQTRKIPKSEGRPKPHSDNPERQRQSPISAMTFVPI
jgi:hypothetical protein